MGKGLSAVVLALVLAGTSAWGDMRLITPHGRRVLLKDDHTWQYVEAANEPEVAQVSLEVVRIVPSPNACRIGLKLVNATSILVTSLVPQFTAYTRDQVPFDTVFQAFTGIKPTNSEYQEIQFTGIDCEDIAYVLVHGADRCSMGELSKFSATKGECLKRIAVRKSDLIRILK